RRLLLGLAPCSHLACPPIPFHRVGRPGASVKGTEILTGVLEATVRDPCRSGPGAKLVCGLTHPRNDRRRQATRPHFHACEASPRGISSLSDRKNTRGEWAGDSTRRGVRSRVMLCRCGFGSGGGFEGDPVAHGGELGDVVAHPAFGGDAVGVVVGSEVVEAGG